MSPTLRFQILERDAFRCRYCGKAGDDGVELEVDHVVPKSKGGTDDRDNLVTACFECNRGKRDREIIPVESVYRVDTIEFIKSIRDACRRVIDSSEPSVAALARDNASALIWMELNKVDRIDNGLMRKISIFNDEFGFDTVAEWMAMSSREKASMAEKNFLGYAWRKRNNENRYDKIRLMPREKLVIAKHAKSLLSSLDCAGL